MTSLVGNPLDLPYRLQSLGVGPFPRTFMREMADPSLVEFKGRYYLFPSVSGGFWYSDDLIGWDFRATPELPVYDYAPDLQEIDGQLVFCASLAKGTCDFYRTADPMSGTWERIPGSFAFFDPCLFQDDDGRVYLYWGSSGKKPVMGQELDRETFRPIGEPVEIVRGQPVIHGWERFGTDWDASAQPKIQTLIQGDTYMEGAWMTKHDGTFYLQYSSTGTQINTYSDGYYTARSPLGPFEYSPYSPFSSNPAGFFTAAGHGATVKDNRGNWWHTATMRISKRHMFERRVGLWPAGFDEDGVLFCNQEFADYPLVMPDGPADPWSLTAREMLLSWRRPVSASSSRPRHPATLAVEEDVRTYWVPATSEPGEWISVELDEGSTVSSIQVNIADHDVKPPRPDRADTGMTLIWRRHIDLSEPPVEVLVEGSMDAVTWESIYDSRGTDLSRTHLFIELDSPRKLRHVRVTGFAQPYGSTFAVSGVRVFGQGAGDPPAAVSPTVRRVGPMNADVHWPAAPSADGYNARYGLAADKLYHSWLVRDANSLDLASLNTGHEYWIAVDSFNANGITRGTPVRVAAEPSEGH
jgi:xylan 1,4-beta-xylosidase